MWNLKYDKNEPIYEAETGIEDRLVVAKGEGALGEGWIASLGLVDTNYYIKNGWTTRTYYIAQGDILNIL